MTSQEEATDLLLMMISEATDIADQGNVILMVDQLGTERVFDLLNTLVELGVSS